MKVIEFECPLIGPLKLIGDRLHDGHDFIVTANSKSTTLDYLLFFDSRGVSAEFDTSLVKLLIERLSDLGKTYLLVCRPINLTTWATLVGFLAQNRLVPTKIVTNMGFVDFTPKKRSLLEDAVRQVDSVIGVNAAKAYFVENFTSRDETIIPLYSIRYDDSYRKAISALAQKYDILILNSPLTDINISIERKRPEAFFLAQAVSNEFNRSVQGAQLLDFPNFDNLHTYDAVHFTVKGNEVIFERLIEFL